MSCYNQPITIQNACYNHGEVCYLSFHLKHKITWIEPSFAFKWPRYLSVPLSISQILPYEIILKLAITRHHKNNNSNRIRHNFSIIIHWQTHKKIPYNTTKENTIWYKTIQYNTIKCYTGIFGRGVILDCCCERRKTKSTPSHYTWTGVT